MNCQKASNLLSAYLDRELSPEERRLLRLHLLACHECSENLGDIEAIKGFLGSLSISRIPALLPWLRVELAMEGMQQEDNTSVFVWQFPWFRRTCAAAALLLLFGLSSWLLLPNRQQNNGPPGGPSILSLPKGSWINSQRIVR